MRIQFSKFALSAILGFALTFTFSCSGGGDEDNDSVGGSSFPDLPKQAYLDGRSEYKGNGDITLRIYGDDSYESKPAGKIQNGQVSLNLPNIENKYLLNWVKNSLCRMENNAGYECNILYPENLTGFTTKGLSVTISNKSCTLVPVLTKSGDYYSNSKVWLDYFSQSGKITGTSCYSGGSSGSSSSGGDIVTSFDCDAYDNYDYNFSKGWNIRYGYPVNANSEDRNITADLSKTGSKLQWWIECE
ncbi:MAG: hypothetical protein LBC87_10975 [Fibromonadaceae bacterium]|jgi:hypothetical protein|nr:hypothetical protein [Fibromonadaceae bacterium]